MYTGNTFFSFGERSVFRECIPEIYIYIFFGEASCREEGGRL